MFNLGLAPLEQEQLNQQELELENDTVSYEELIGYYTEENRVKEELRQLRVSLDHKLKEHQTLLHLQKTLNKDKDEEIKITLSELGFENLDNTVDLEGLITGAVKGVWNILIAIIHKIIDLIVGLFNKSKGLLRVVKRLNGNEFRKMVDNLDEDKWQVERIECTEAVPTNEYITSVAPSVFSQLKNIIQDGKDLQVIKTEKLIAISDLLKWYGIHLTIKGNEIESMDGGPEEMPQGFQLQKRTLGGAGWDATTMMQFSNDMVVLLDETVELEKLAKPMRTLLGVIKMATNKTIAHPEVSVDEWQTMMNIINIIVGAHSKIVHDLASMLLAMAKLVKKYQKR